MRIVPALSVHEQNWVAKAGQPGLAVQAEYDWEQQAMAENRYASVLQRAFDLAGIEYGRVDFGLVAGAPQIYEINTNPYIPPSTNPHQFETRTANQAQARQALIEALKLIDTPSGFWRRNSIANSRLILEQMQRDGKHTASRWMP